MDVLALARKQLADYDCHQPGMLFAGDAPNLTIDEAYQIQMEVGRLRHERGEAIAGYKIGCLSPAIQAQFGIDRPVFGQLYASELQYSGAILDPARYAGLAVEGELAVRVADGGEIVSAFAVIEVHNYVFRNLPPAAQELIVNNAFQAGVILPDSGFSIKNPGELRHAPVSVWKNGELLGAAAGSLDGLGPLAEHLARFGRKLESGDIVLTGSALPLYPVTGGDVIKVRCEVLGQEVVAAIAATPQLRSGSAG